MGVWFARRQEAGVGGEKGVFQPWSHPHSLGRWDGVGGAKMWKG